MQLGAVTYNVLKDWDLEKIITTLEASGFSGVELRTEHAHKIEPSISQAEREKVKQRFARSKVRLVSFGTTSEFHSPDPAVRRKHVETAKTFIDLAHDTGAWGIKVRPNGLPAEVPVDTTIGNIGACLKELGDYGMGKGVEIYMEVHGRETQVPPIAARIMKAANHSNVGACWNSNPTDIVNGSIKPSFDLLRPFIKHVHINELAGPYPYRELFKLLRESKYDRYTLCECQESKEPERFLRWYAALWNELNRA
jgi:sugar phosphate isomerase/epimerase